MESQAVRTSSPVFELLIVKLSVTTESQLTLLVKVCVAELLLTVYITESIQVYELQAVITSVPVLELLIVKFNVTTESQFAVLVNVWVAELLLDV